MYKAFSGKKAQIRVNALSSGIQTGGTVRISSRGKAETSMDIAETHTISHIPKAEVMWEESCSDETIRQS